MLGLQVDAQAARAGAVRRPVPRAEQQRRCAVTSSSCCGGCHVLGQGGRARAPVQLARGTPSTLSLCLSVSLRTITVFMQKEGRKEGRRRDAGQNWSMPPAYVFVSPPYLGFFFNFSFLSLSYPPSPPFVFYISLPLPPGFFFSSCVLVLYSFFFSLFSFFLSSFFLSFSFFLFLSFFLFFFLSLFLCS